MINMKLMKMQNTIVICDEFDLILFGNDNDVLNAAKMFHKLRKLIGFTGSDQREFHVKAAERAIEGLSIKINVSDIFKPIMRKICWLTNFRELASRWKCSGQRLSQSQTVPCRCSLEKTTINTQYSSSRIARVEG